MCKVGSKGVCDYPIRFNSQYLIIAQNEALRAGKIGAVQRPSSQGVGTGNTFQRVANFGWAPSFSV